MCKTPLNVFIKLEKCYETMYYYINNGKYELKTVASLLIYLINSKIINSALEHKNDWLNLSRIVLNLMVDWILHMYQFLLLLLFVFSSIDKYLTLKYHIKTLFSILLSYYYI